MKNLGVTFNRDGLMSDHINVLCRNGFFSLYRISKIRNLLDRPTTEKLVHAFVTSQIDYCNSLLFGISKLQLARLLSLQNAASRLIYRTRRFESITPVLKDLHWLPITARIRFKILLITFKIILGIVPKGFGKIIFTSARPAIKCQSAFDTTSIRPFQQNVW